MVVNGGGDCCAYNVASSCTAILDKSQVKMGVFKSPDKMLIYAVSCLFHVCMRASTDPLFMTTSMSRRERFIAFLLFLLAGALLLTSPRDVTSSDPALLVRTAVITCAMLVAIGILSGPLVHVEKQRDHAWYVQMRSLQRFSV